MALDGTHDRIVSAATDVILAQGVRKMSLADVAYRAGVTRVTVYRYFGDKHGVVRAVCQRIAAMFRKAAQPGHDTSMRDLNTRLNQLGEDLGQLSGSLPKCLEEISQAYPDDYQQFRAVRQEAIDQLFQQALAAAAREQTLREGLNLQVLEAIFWPAVIGLIENPAIASSNISPAEVFFTITDVFRHGILKQSTEGEGHGKQ
ncbi:MAG: TetR/AcrR family transcriptional regulator [Planctomycetaceae bacterium]|nr:TetR/AcrR family transcriptional regulator [Planctomycetaceae bacterium]